MKKFCLSLSVFLLALLLLFCSCGNEETPTTSNETTAPNAIQTTAKTTAQTTAFSSVQTPVETTPTSSTPNSTQTENTTAAPILPGNVCLNEIDKMTVKALSFETSEDFSGNIFISYVFNDNASDLDQKILNGMENKTVFAAVRVNGTLYPIADSIRSGVYLNLDLEKAGALLVKGFTYSVSLEFYDTNNSLLCYSYTERLASTVSTKKEPERTPLTVTLPTEGLTKVTVNQSTLSIKGFTLRNNSSLSYLVDNKTTTKLIGTADETVPTLFFSLSKAETLTHYTIYTANDAKSYPDYNPVGWRLYGKVGDMWMLLSKVEKTATDDPGIKAENSAAFSYAIPTPRQCRDYKIEFIYNSTTMQLGELTLYATNGYSASAPNPNAGSCLTTMSNVSVTLSGFDLISELQNHVGLVYHFTSTDSLAETIRQGLVSGELFATITLDNTIYQIDAQIWNGDALCLDLQAAGAPVFADVGYHILLGIYNKSGERLYYTSSQSMSSPYETPNLPDRSGMNITLPSGLTQVKVSTSSVKTEDITHFGDGDPKQLFDGDTKNSKIGGYTDETGEFTLTFKLTSAATLTYYTFYTGNDTASVPERNPLGWAIYGKVNGEYVLLSEVRESGVAYSGLEGVNATPYSYRIDSPQSCSEYMIVFETTGIFQLNEMILYK